MILPDAKQRTASAIFIMVKISSVPNKNLQSFYTTLIFISVTFIRGKMLILEKMQAVLVIYLKRWYDNLCNNVSALFSYLRNQCLVLVIGTAPDYYPLPLWFFLQMLLPFPERIRMDKKFTHFLFVMMYFFIQFYKLCANICNRRKLKFDSMVSFVQFIQYLRFFGKSQTTFLADKS